MRRQKGTSPPVHISAPLRDKVGVNNKLFTIFSSGWQGNFTDPRSDPHRDNTDLELRTDQVRQAQGSVLGVVGVPEELGALEARKIFGFGNEQLTRIFRIEPASGNCAAGRRL